VAAYMTLLTLLLLIVYIFKTFRQSDGIYENRKQLEQ
jgi:hypothetical protein